MRYTVVMLVWEKLVCRSDTPHPKGGSWRLQNFWNPLLTPIWFDLKLGICGMVTHVGDGYISVCQQRLPVLRTRGTSMPIISWDTLHVCTWCEKQYPNFAW